MGENDHGHALHRGERARVLDGIPPRTELNTV